MLLCNYYRYDLFVWFHSEQIKALRVSFVNGMRRRAAALKQAKGGKTKY